MTSFATIDALRKHADWLRATYDFGYMEAQAKLCEFAADELYRLSTPPSQDKVERATTDPIAEVLVGLSRAFEAEYAGMTETDLRDRWYFQFNTNATLTSNLYAFYGALTLYGGSCRRWEEAHNGSMCVVERVRDKYLIPKIADLAAAITQALAESSGQMGEEASAILRTLNSVPDSAEISETDAKVSVGLLRRLLASGQGTDGACCEAMREKAAKAVVSRLSHAAIEWQENNAIRAETYRWAASHAEKAIRALPVSADGRDAVIEECAQICDAEFRLRKSLLDNPDPDYGDPNIQGHKSVTALKLAEKLRTLKSKQPSDTERPK